MRSCDNIFRIISLLALLAPACSGQNQPIANVNGEPIYREEFNQALKIELSRHDAKKDAEILKQAVLKRLIKEKTLYSAAKKYEILVNDQELSDEYTRLKSQYTEASFRKMLELKGIDYAKWKEDKKREVVIEKLIQQEVASRIDINDAEVKKYYRRHIKEFSHGDEVHARQILVDDEKLAGELRAKAASGDNFAALAQEYSIAPEGKHGGDLGWFPHGIMPKAFDEACFPLPAGSISPVVKTEFGYHIFKVVERRPSGTVKMEDVKDKIITRLKQEQIGGAFDAWFEPIRKEAKVEIYENLLKDIK